MATGVHLQASNGEYVCAEGGGGGPVVANRALAQVWETFILLDIGGAPLVSGDRIVLQANDGKFVCAEGGGGREVVASRDVASTWETWKLLLADGSSSTIGNGAKIALQASNDQFMSAEGGGGGPVVASATSIGPSETFTLELLGKVPFRADTGMQVVGAGEYMDTVVSFQSDGKILQVTKTECHKYLAGFTGGISTLIVDKNGNVIANTQGRRFGVDGRYTGLTWSRSDGPFPEDAVDSSIYDQCDRIVVVQSLSPHNRFIEDIKQGIAIGKDVVSAVAEIKKAF